MTDLIGRSKVLAKNKLVTDYCDKILGGANLKEIIILNV